MDNTTQAQRPAAYFISDVHLHVRVDDLEHKRRQELFLLMDQIKREKATLFIVGDWFDFYFEYSYVVTKTYLDVYTKMRELVEAGIEIHYFGGNHDYWLGDFMSTVIGVHIHQRATLIEFAEKKFWILHGDGLDKEDKGYLRLKRIIRNPFLIWGFKWLINPNLGHLLAKWISKHSHNQYNDETTEHLINSIRKNYPLAEEKFAEGIDYMITGHIHYPKLTTFGENALLTIGDFLNYYSYGYFDGLNLSLKQWPVKQLEQRELP